MWTKNVSKNQSWKTFPPASVTTTAAAIGADVGDLGANQAIILTGDPANTATVYIGDATVTTSNGTPIIASEKLSAPHYNLNDLYAVSASGTQILRIALI